MRDGGDAVLSPQRLDIRHGAPNSIGYLTIGAVSCLQSPQHFGVIEPSQIFPSGHVANGRLYLIRNKLFGCNMPQVISSHDAKPPRYASKISAGRSGCGLGMDLSIPHAWGGNRRADGFRQITHTRRYLPKYPIQHPRGNPHTISGDRCAGCADHGYLRHIGRSMLCRSQAPR